MDYLEKRLKEKKEIKLDYVTILMGKTHKVGTIRGTDSEGLTRYLAEVKGRTECWLLIPSTGFFKEEALKLGEENDVESI